MLPLISVIIPTYNRLAFLKEAIASVRAQTFTDFELIIVDDCSDDGTREALESDRDLRYLRLDQRHFPSGARNQGAAVSRGRYIAFLDSDDLWHPEKLSRQADLFGTHPELRISHTDEQWIRDGRPVNQRQRHTKEGGYIFERCLHLCLISPSAVILERTLFDAYGGFDPALEVGEDYHLWLRITARETIGFIPDPLTIKRGGHPDQLSHKYGQIEIFRIQALEKVLAADDLNPEQLVTARRVFADKCRIYAKGCRKHGRPREAAEYERKAAENS